MSTDIELPQESKPPTIGETLTKWQPVFTKLLDETGISEQAFTANIAQAYRATPELDQCDISTVLGAGLRCAQLGLTPNDTRNLAWMIPRFNKKTGRKEASFQLGYGGIMELARRHTPGLRFDGRAVYPNDEFDLDFGKAEPLTHKPYYTLGHSDRGGDAIVWYVRALFPDGSVQVQALDKKGVEYHRSFSQMKDSGMWKNNYDAAALKSCVVDMKRWLPASSQMAAATLHDEAVVKIEDVEPINVGEIEHASEGDE
jgi:recombination protein RecT